MHQPLKELIFKRSCDLCTLSAARRMIVKGERVDPGAVPGAGPIDYRDVKLIVVSEHPSINEERAGHAMYSNEQDRMPSIKKSLLGWQTAGALLRTELTRMYGLDTYTDCYITNIIKCNNREVTITDIHLTSCIRQWFIKEMDILDQYVPSVPILVAGSAAIKGLTNLDAETRASYDKITIAALRGDLTHYYKKHPLVFTINPVAVANCIMRLEVHNNCNKAMELKPLVGSPLWLFRKDLAHLRQYFV